MSGDRSLVPTSRGDLNDPNIAGDAVSAEIELLGQKMLDAMNGAVASLLTQNIRQADLVARTAEALYATAKPGAKNDELIMLFCLKQIIIVFPPLLRGMRFLTEGRFSNAREEFAKGLAICNVTVSAFNEYQMLPDHDQNILEISQVPSIFQIMFSGLDAHVAADTVGYQGDIAQYRDLLRLAVETFRKAEDIPPSMNEMLSTLVAMCLTHAENLSTRLEVSASWTQSRYLRPISNKILIIHGHAEAKWRELQGLLKNEFGLESTILKEEPGSGETLIQKFEKFADGCCYAFALLTPDDFIEKEGTSYFQARPNVLFEIGWFYGHFGRDRVCIIKKDGTGIPSDLAGMITIDYHENVSEGLLKIRAELQRIGITASRPKRQNRRSPARV